MPALLALLAAVGWGSSDYAAGSASRRSSAVSVVVLTHLAAFVALVCLAVDFGPVWATVADVRDTLLFDGRPGGVRWSGPVIGGDPALADIRWGLAAGLGGGLGAMLLFRGLGKGSMAVVAPITATGAASIPALYGILTGEAVTFVGVFGILLALVAIVLVSLSGDPDDEPVAAGARSDVELDERLRTDRLAACGSPAAPFEGSEIVAGAPDPPSAAPPAAVGPLVTGDPLLVGDPLVAPPAFAAWTGPDVPPPPPPPPPDPAPLTAPLHTVGRQPVGGRAVDASGEIRMSLRRVRSTIVALTIAALLAAAIAAAEPIGSVVAGDGLGAGGVASLALAFVVVGLAIFATHATRLLFQVRAARPAHLERRTNPPSFDARSNRVERRTDLSTFGLASMLRQPGVPEALLSGVGFGAFFVFISRAAESAGYWPLVSARAISVVMFAIAALVTSTALLPERRSRRAVVVAGLLDAAAAVFFVLATRAGLLSVGAVLASLYPGVTVLLARFVGQERIRRQQMLGLALAAVAVSLLAI